MTSHDSRPGADHLECTACGSHHPSEQLVRLSPCCDKPLYARYDITALRGRFTRERVAARAPDLWRYAELLPVRDQRFRPGLGEGFTPLVDAPRLAEELGVARLLVKDEGQNPTGSFKARGLSLAVARAAELGAGAIALPSAGNAACAASAYGAALGLPVHVVVPRDTPAPIVEAIRALGADLRLLDGIITDCARVVQEGARAHGWFDVSTLKEPYRVEGKKTMAYELVEQLDGRLPDVIIYPTGGGTGLVGMWKAFHELEALGWIGSERPRMVSVQAAGCAPIVKAFESGAEAAETWEDAATYAAGLRVPAAVGDFLMLRALRESGGAAVAVEDRAMAADVARLGAATGIFACPEGGATLAAARALVARGLAGAGDCVALFNTGSGFNYAGMEPLESA